jgi:hypothetical protein
MSMASMVEALTPLACASPANCFFHVSKPTAVLPHCAAIALPVIDTSAATSTHSKPLFDLGFPRYRVSISTVTCDSAKSTEHLSIIVRAPLLGGRDRHDRA